jgi:hypothetical protein
MSEDIERRALAAADQRRIDSRARETVENERDGTRLRQLLARLGIAIEYPLTYPEVEIGRVTFTLDKKLAEIGSDYDYTVVATVRSKSDPTYKTRPVQIRTLADLGEAFEMANAL